MENGSSHIGTGSSHIENGTSHIEDGSSHRENGEWTEWKNGCIEDGDVDTWNKNGIKFTKKQKQVTIQPYN